MGSLITTPFSQISATLEILDNRGVRSEDFDRLRQNHRESRVLKEIVRLLRIGHKDEPIDCRSRGHLPPNIRHEEYSVDTDPVQWDPVSAQALRHPQMGSCTLSQACEYIRSHALGRHLNARVQEYLTAYPEQIPFSWQAQDRIVIFGGTVYFGYDDHLYYPALRWEPEEQWAAGLIRTDADYKDTVYFLVGPA